MTNTNLIIAVVFVGLFCLAVIFSALWCIDCYMHWNCLDISQYLHNLSLHPAQPSSVVCVEKHRSRAGNSMRGRRHERLQRQTDHGYRDCEQGRMRDGNLDMRPMTQFYAPMQAQQEPLGQPYRPPLRRRDQVQNVQPMMQQQIPVHWQAQGGHQASPFAMRSEMPQQPTRQTATRMSKPGQGLAQHHPQGLPQRRQPHGETAFSEISGVDQQKSFPVEGKPPEQQASRARKVDYIHLCDEYPPIVLKALEKAALASPTSSSSSSSTSSSSWSNASGTTEEIPRTSIGCATSACVTNSPIQLPRHCYVATGARIPRARTLDSK